MSHAKKSKRISGDSSGELLDKNIVAKAEQYIKKQYLISWIWSGIMMLILASSIIGVIISAFNPDNTLLQDGASGIMSIVMMVAILSFFIWLLHFVFTIRAKIVKVIRNRKFSYRIGAVTDKRVTHNGKASVYTFAFDDGGFEEDVMVSAGIYSNVNIGEPCYIFYIPNEKNENKLYAKFCQIYKKS